MFRTLALGITVLFLSVAVRAESDLPETEKGIRESWNEFWGTEQEPPIGRFQLMIGRSFDYSNSKSEVIYLIDTAAGQVWMQEASSNMIGDKFQPITPGYWRPILLPIGLVKD